MIIKQQFKFQFCFVQRTILECLNFVDRLSNNKSFSVKDQLATVAETEVLRLDEQLYTTIGEDRTDTRHSGILGNNNSKYHKT